MKIGQKIFLVAQAICCPLCGECDGNHKDGCPHGQLEQLIKINCHFPCPVCGENEVGVNAEDFYECRKCHTQFSSSEIVDCENPKEAIIIVDPDGDIVTGAIHVLILENKGKGNFPLDKAIKKLQKELQAKNK